MIKYFIGITLALLLGLAYQILPLLQADKLSGYTKLDSIYVNSETAFIGRSTNKSNDNVYWAIDSRKDAKLSNVAQLADNVYLSPRQAENGWSFANPFNDKLEADLKMISNAESYYKLSFENNIFSLYSPSEKFEMWGKEYTTTANSVPLLENFNRPTAIAFSNDVYQIDLDTLQYDFKPYEIFNRNITGYSALSPPLVKDSFDNGKWAEFKDCKDRGEGSVEFMQSIEGRQNIIEMRNGSAQWSCAGRGFERSLQENKIYKVSFDYKVEEGQGLSYFYNIGNGEIGGKFDGKQYFNNVQGKPSDGWLSHSYIIKPEFDATEFDFFFYLDANDTQRSRVRLDNFKLEELVVEDKAYLKRKDIDINDRKVIESVAVEPGTTKVTYGQKNLIGGNSNFESGSWSNIKDCENRHGGIKLMQDLGNNFVEIGPDGDERTCTSETFPIRLEKSKNYKLKFKYKNVRGKKLQFYYNLINKRKEINKQFFVNEEVEEGQWLNFEKVIEIPTSGFEAIDLFFYASELQAENNVNYIDDIELFEYSPKNLESQYLHSILSVDRESKKPLDLTGAKFSELPERIIVMGNRAYNPHGILELNGKSILSFGESKHIKLNNNLNGWIVDLKSACTIQQNCTSGNIKFTYTSFGVKQKLWLSCTVLVYLGALGYGLLRNMKNKER